MQLRLKDLKDKHVRSSVHMFFKQPHSLPRLVSDTVKHSDGSVDIRVVAQSDLRTAFKGCVPAPRTNLHMCLSVCRSHSPWIIESCLYISKPAMKRPYSVQFWIFETPRQHSCKYVRSS